MYGDSKLCSTSIHIAETIEGPIFVYYQLENFYQNHRRYVRSRSYQQLMGQSLSADEIQTDCEPIYRNSDLSPYITKALDSSSLIPEAAANPCGLIAKSIFTD